MTSDNSRQQSARYPLADASASGCIVIHCSDPRFQPAFRRFVREELGISNSMPIVVPGGIHDLVSPARIEAARQLWAQVEFMVRIGTARRIVLMNHEDCLWYRKWKEPTHGTLNERLIDYLLTAAEKLAERELGLDVECYLARIEGDAVTFHRVDPTGDG